MILGCVIFYNDGAELLEKCLTSIKGKVQKIIGIDGRFSEFPLEGELKNFSSDGCLEIAMKYCDLIITNREPWKDQIEKRNAYLILKSERDYYFILDSDEVFEGEFPRLDELYENAYSFPLIVDSVDPPIQSFATRLIRHQNGLEYRVRHSYLWIRGQIVNKAQFLSFDSAPCLNCGKIKHYPHLRNKRWTELDGIYQENRKERFTLEPREYQLDQNFVKIKNNGVDYCSWNEETKNEVVIRSGEIASISKRFADRLIQDFPESFQLI